MKFIQKLTLIIFMLFLATPQVAPITPRTQYLGAGTGISLLLTFGVMHKNYLEVCKKQDPISKKIKEQGFLTFCRNFKNQENLIKKYPKTIALLALNGSLITATTTKFYLEYQNKKAITKKTEEDKKTQDQADQNDETNTNPQNNAITEPARLEREDQEDAEQLINDETAENEQAPLEEVNQEIREKASIAVQRIKNHQEKRKDELSIKSRVYELAKEAELYDRRQDAFNMQREASRQITTNTDTKNKERINAGKALELIKLQHSLENFSLLLGDEFQAEEYIKICNLAEKISEYQSNSYDNRHRNHNYTLATIDELNELPRILTIFLNFTEKLLTIAPVLNIKHLGAYYTTTIGDIKKLLTQVPVADEIPTDEILTSFNNIFLKMKKIEIYIRLIK